MAQPWSKDKESVIRSVDENIEKGLSQSGVASRLKQHGPNQLVKERRTTFWGVFKEEVMEPMILLLLVVGVVYSVWGEARDAITIFAIITALVFSEIFTEYRAKKAVAALRKLSPSTAAVLRDGLQQRIPIGGVVPEDILVLEMGDRVPADARIIESFGMEVDESTLTGESVPVAKEDRRLPSETSLADRVNMVFAGTTITRGWGRAIVTGTGMNTELGRITGLVLEGKEPKTPLQLAMKQLAGILVWVAVFFSVLIPAVRLIQERSFQNWQQLVLTGLSLSFATIPEELPIIVTMVLGVGAFALSRKHVLIRRLRAAETLGSVTVIATDKTGTLTENRMMLVGLAIDKKEKPFQGDSLSPADRMLLEAGVLTSRVKRSANGYVGDPMEIAFVEAASKGKVAPETVRAKAKLQKEFSFDSQRRMMSVAVKRDEGVFVYAKGAPEVILSRSSRVVSDSGERPKTEEDDNALMRIADEMAGRAMRVLGLAYKKAADGANLGQEEAERDLVFIGFAGLADPPREGVKEAIQITTRGGVRTIVVSGDHPLTVRRIASEVGITSNGKVVTGGEFERMNDEQLKVTLRDVSLFARITPEQKLRIVRALQESGHVVGVTGDGINDGPALKSADIGIAMGEAGTEVAREAAGMILTDDSFTSIAAGVREGRKIYDNLKKGVSYYLSVKIALVLSFLVPLFLGVALPFAPIQIILLELFMDLAASATFVAEPMEPDVMQRPPPSRREKFLGRVTLVNISWGSISLAAAVLINYLFAWYSGWNQVEAQTIAFATWLVGHIFLAFTMRSQRESLPRIGFLSNRVMLIWAAATLVFLVIITNLPATQAAFRVASLTARSWAMAVVVPLLTIFWFELRKYFIRRSQHHRVDASVSVSVRETNRG